MKDRETLHYFRNFFKLNIVTVAQLVESCATVFLYPTLQMQKKLQASGLKRLQVYSVKAKSRYA